MTFTFVFEFKEANKSFWNIISAIPLRWSTARGHNNALFWGIFKDGRTFRGTVKSREGSTSRGVSNSKREERRGEPESEGRKGEFVNTLLLFIFFSPERYVANGLPIRRSTSPRVTFRRSLCRSNLVPWLKCPKLLQAASLVSFGAVSPSALFAFPSVSPLSQTRPLAIFNVAASSFSTLASPTRLASRCH